jgi:glycosyltransferase involved in cell wall biosynthesis
LEERKISTGQSVLLQAMALGKAVIATKCVGTQDYVEHMTDGILVEPCDHQKLRNAIQLLMDKDELRAELGNNARKKVVEKYLPHHYLDNVCQVLRDSINRR